MEFNKIAHFTSNGKLLFWWDTKVTTPVNATECISGRNTADDCSSLKPRKEYETAEHQNEIEEQRSSVGFEVTSTVGA